jgi:hypothetical protein
MIKTFEVAIPQTNSGKWEMTYWNVSIVKRIKVVLGFNTSLKRERTNSVSMWILKELLLKHNKILRKTARGLLSID